MDRETAKIILKWDENHDFEDHLESYLFDFKKEFILLTHPKLIKKKLEILARSIDAINFLNNSNISKNEIASNPSSDSLDFFKYYQVKEAEKSNLKLWIQSEDDLSKLYVHCLMYESFYMNWHQTLANIELTHLDLSDVKQSTNVNPMDLYNDIKSWSEQNFAPKLIQKTNFAVLYDEICRSKIILEQL